ncbi:isopenicillin N synthase family oxygenase [Parvibaculum sedimenti]|uniref:2-oxoglutarate-dependent ethylene/succinate-forming enzyme n=1 Tax=Parvibaculum sedimenti TaxID=2608632 RepID=A0A6N6VLR4_9HYPH|nr:2-oxoglutarate and iron-dependent oxygenase domain-containing protein [Parvibaculum sedimenti]KAB7741712.1 isopenicillin N synthase family oxygenase [Parvibaculum sedimenti]
MTLKAVPVIDISPFLKGTPAGKQKVAAEVGRACRDIGFLVITGHGVPEALIQQTYDTAKAFFDLPEEEKMKVERPSPDQVRGYSPLMGEGLAYSLDDKTPPDLKESFSIGPTNVPAGAPYYTGPEAGPHFAPNVWPASPSLLKPVWTEYFHAMENLSAQLMAMFAMALDLPEDFFEDKIDKHISMLRALNYPDQNTPPEPGQMRAGAHSDYGSLTIVRQEEAPGGLEVLNDDGEWVPAKPVPGAFVVNIGDLMMQWTNDTWKSTMHRVVNPPRDKALGSRRISLVFFHQPNYDAMVTCLDSCHDENRPIKYAPISSGDHLKSKFVKQTSVEAA